MAVSVFVALSHEVHDVLVADLEVQVHRQHWLNVLCCDHLAVTLVEEAEALLGLLVLAGLAADASVPMVGHHVLAELKVHGVAVQEPGVGLFELFLDVAGAHFVEAEVLKDVLEKVVGDGVLTLFKVVVEALLEIAGHLGRDVATGRGLVGGLCDALGLLLLHGGLLRVHFYFLISF